MATKKTVYVCTALTGGTSGALDFLPYNSLQDGELAFTITDDYVYIHIFDASSSSSESSPDVIAPDDIGSNTGRWLLRLSFLEPLYVDRINGNVGLGTLTPIEKFHISNGVAIYDSDRNISSLYHLVDKKYVDEAVTSLGARYYMTDTNSGTADYKLCSLTPSTESEQSFSKTDLDDDEYIIGWISPNTNEPDKLITGVFNWRIYAEKTSGTKTLRLYWKLIERKSDNSEDVIGTSIVSNEITNGKNLYIIPLTLSADHEIASDSYIVGKIYADVSGSGNAPSVTLYYAGSSASHWQIPVNPELLDNSYVNVSGDTMTGDLLFTGGTRYIGTLDNNSFVIKTNNTNRVFFDSSGKVGIWETNPDEAIHVSGKGYFTEGVRIRQDVADYGGNFTNYTPPTGASGLIILAEDTNATNPARRLYAYVNGSWRYVDLT